MINEGEHPVQEPRDDVQHRSFARSLPMALLAARESVMGRFRAELHRIGLTEQQWRVLRALVAHDEVEVMELARICALLPPSLSRILKELEACGYISRRPSEQDMRRSLSSLTASGRDLIASYAPYSERVYADIETAFGKDRLESLYRLLGELKETLDALPAPVIGEPAPGPRMTRGRKKRGARASAGGDGAEPHDEIA